MKSRLNLMFLLWAVLTGFDPAANPLLPFDQIRATYHLYQREISAHPCAIRECEGK